MQNHGKNCPPIHPNDRCTTVAEFGDEEIEGLTRRARDENGKSILVPQNMRYKEWYNNYVDKDEGITDNLFNKNKKVKLKDITTQKDIIINKAFKNENIKNIALSTNIESIKLGGSKAYHRNGNIVLRDNYNKRTLIHEIGHTVDYENKWLSSTNSFIEAIQKDKQYILNNQDTFKKLIENNMNHKELSDIIGGITDNKVVGKYKHKNNYWKKANKLERETFAQMFTMAGNDDIKQLEVFQKYLPNIFKEFDDLIRRLL